jgi:SAM-dependent methyltransferase
MRLDVELPWTGERLVTSHVGDTAVEHLHRYAFAREFAEENDVLDIACGEGYGSFLLGDVAKSVIGVDMSPEVVDHARARYGDCKRLSFSVGTCSNIPLDTASVDLVVSFETLEHHDEHLEMFREVKRVLRPGGTLIISTPDRLNCTILPKNYNPYHVRELFKEDFSKLLSEVFTHVYLFEQRICHASVLTPQAGHAIAEFRHYQGDFRRLFHTKGISKPLFNIGVATDREFPPPLNMSLFEGMEIPTEVEKHLNEAVRVNAELNSKLSERDHLLAHLEQVHLAEVARIHERYQREAAELDLHYCGKNAALNEKLVALCTSFSALEQERSLALQQAQRELQLVRAQLLELTSSRSWMLTQTIKQAATVVRRLIDLPRSLLPRFSGQH